MSKGQSTPYGRNSKHFRRQQAHAKLKDELAELLFAKIKESGITPQKMAEELGIDKEWMRVAFIGRNRLTVETVQDMLGVLGYKLVWTAERK